MFDFTEEQKMVRKVVRKWVEDKLAPANADLEAERRLPFELIRDFVVTFGVDELARSSLERAEEKSAKDEANDWGAATRDVAMSSIVALEQSRVSPGFAMSMAATIGLYGAAVMRKGTLAQ